MGAARQINLTVVPANCRCPGAADRGSAQRLLVGHAPPPAIPLPDLSPVTAPGRVFSLGRFRSHLVTSSLATELPKAVQGSLRTELEWYACRGAFFHNDAHYGNVLFGAWCVAGPARDVVFARAGLRVRAGVGDWLVFDPFEPHAVIDPHAGHYRRDGYVGSPASVFIGFELALSPEVRAEFGIGSAKAGAPLLSSDVAVNAETGALG